MKEIVVISGKGGTGKTTVTASLGATLKNCVLADCDVDAADLYLLYKPQVRDDFKFWGMPKANIIEDKCIRCGKCQQVCRFDAIDNFKVDATFCEGCKVCYNVCLENAIEIVDVISGHWYISDTKYGPMVHARLGTAEENSGKLVSLVKKAAREIAEREGYDNIIIDGPPGIGCPVIAALSGADIAIVVVEPTVAGIHDLDRVLKLAANFKTTIKVLINKWDISPEKAREIEDFCKDNNIEVIGKIPFDEDVIKSITQGIPLVEYSKGSASKILKDIAYLI